MKGRDENTIKIEKGIERRLINAPEVISDFYYSFTDATPTTKRAYIGYVLQLNEYFKDKDIVKLNTNDINRFMNHIRYTNGIENKEDIRRVKLYAIKRFYKFLKDNKYIEENPCENIKPPKSNIDREVIAMDKSDIDTVHNNIKNGCGNKLSVARQKNWRNRDDAIITLGVSTGLRVTAISEINISDINFDNNLIKVTEKENYTRDVMIGENTKQSLKQWIKDREKFIEGHDDCDALFISNQRKRMSVRSIQYVVEKYTNNLDKHITPHKMRSTCGTYLYDVTGDIYRVQNQLGHKNIEVSKRYARMSKDKIKESTNILDALSI